MDNKTPANACHRCGAKAYRPVIARDASGAMTPSGAYRCVQCKLEFTSIDQWRLSGLAMISPRHMPQSAVQSKHRM